MGLCNSCSGGESDPKDILPVEADTPMGTTMTENERIDFFRNVELFKRLPPEEHKVLAQIVEEERYSPGHQLIRQGDQGEEFFVIKSGTVGVSVDNKRVASLKAGDYVGEVALLRDEPRNATIIVETSLIVLKITRTKFREMKLNEKLEFKKRVAVASGGEVVIKPPSVKTAEDRKVMLEALKNNQNLTGMVTLDDAKCNAMIDKAWEEQVLPGTDVITQGSDQADYFYIVKKGTFEILIEKTDAAKSAETTLQRQSQVGTIPNGGSFGELALIFLAPRAATIRAQEACVVWVIDRETFKSILMQSAEEQKRKNLKYLNNSDFFSVLKEDEKLEIVKAFNDMVFEEGEVIFKQGDIPATSFYILVDGEVEVSKDAKQISRLKATPDKGEVFGQTVLSSSDARDSSAKVVSKAATTLTMDRKTFELLLGPYEDIKKRGSSGGETMVGKAQEVKVATKARDTIKRSDLKVLGLLGCGGFGAVELVEHQTTKATYALKSLSKGHVVKTKMQKSTIREKTIQYMCDSPFVVKLYECYNTEQNLMLLLELALGGELYDTYCKKGFHGSEPHAKFYVGSTMFAFEHLHERKIVYRDLKPENLLLAEGGVVKLTDMGLAKVVAGNTNTTCGTPDYFAPEVIGSSGHSLPVDWWTLGILTYELMAGNPPFESASPATTMKHIRAGIAKVAFPPKLQGGIEKFVKALLKNAPMDRLPMKSGGTDNIKKHEWFKGFDWDKLFTGKMDPPYKPKIKSSKDRANFSPNPADKPPQIPYKDDGSGWDKEFATSE